MMVVSMATSSCAPSRTNHPTALTAEQNAKLVSAGILPGPDATQSPIAVISAAIDRYELSLGSLPETLDDLFEGNDQAGWRGPYLPSKNILKDPNGNTVQSTKSTLRYQLRFPGPDGKYETADDITN